MEQDTFMMFPLHEQFPSLFDPSFFFCGQSAGGASSFSPRESSGCSPRANTFFGSFPNPSLNAAVPSSTTSAPSSSVPDAVEWDSTGSVGSRRSSDEFSEASTKPTMEWRKPLESAPSFSNLFHMMPVPPPPPAHPAKVSSRSSSIISTISANGTKIFICKEPGCNKTYTTTEGLRLHNRNIHMKDKKHACQVEGCDRAFVRASDLKLHILRIHEKERPFPCTEPDCTKSFACNSELTRHLNCHNRSRANRSKRMRAASGTDSE